MNSSLTYTIRIRSQPVQFDFLPVPFKTEVSIQSADVRGTWQMVRKFTLDCRNINFEIRPMRFLLAVFSLPGTSASSFKFVLRHLTKNPGTDLKDIRLMSHAVLDQAIEKQLGKLWPLGIPWRIPALRWTGRQGCGYILV